MKTKARFSGFILVLTALTAGAIAMAASPGSGDIAIVSRADLVGTIDIQALAAAPIFTLASGKHSISQAAAARNARIKMATGLTKKDILSAVFSCNTTSIKYTAPTRRQRLESLQGILAVQLAKPVTIAQIRQAIKLEYGSEERAGVSSITINGYPALVVKAPDKNNPDIFVAITPNKKVLLTALNAASLHAALQRSKTGNYIGEPRKLNRLRQSMPPRSQIKLGAIVPRWAQDMLTRQSKIMLQQSKQDPRMAAAASIPKLFENIQTISIGVLVSNDVLLTVAGDLNSRAAANQAGALIKTLLIPIMQAALQKNNNGNGNIDLTNQIKVRSSGSDLFIQLRIPAHQLISAKNRKKKSPKAGRKG
jgi:hypothetical protein